MLSIYHRKKCYREKYREEQDILGWLELGKDEGNIINNGKIGEK